MPTYEEIESAKTTKGGWTKAQLAVWGVPWPPPPGWRKRITTLDHYPGEPSIVDDLDPEREERIAIAKARAAVKHYPWDSIVKRQMEWFLKRRHWLEKPDASG